MKHKTLFLGMILVLVGLFIVQQSIDPEDTDDADMSSDHAALGAGEDPMMQNAHAKAQETLGYFLGVAESQPSDTQGFSVKVAVEDQELTEYFWVYPFEQEEEGFSGRINSEPQIVDNVFEGEVIDFDRSQIVDWTFEDTATGIMHGNYTGCVLLEREAPENAAQFQKLYGLDCDK